jgi:hypothetical protein
MVSLKSHRNNKNKNRSKRNKQYGEHQQLGGSVSSDSVVALVRDNNNGSDNTGGEVQGMQQDFMMEGQLPPKVLDTLTKEFVASPTNQVHKISGGGQKFSKQFLQNIINDMKGKHSQSKVLNDMKKTWDKYNDSKLSDNHSKIIYNDLSKANSKFNNKFNKKTKGGGKKNNFKKSIKQKTMKGGFFKGIIPEHWFTTGAGMPQNKILVDTVKIDNCPQPKTLPPAYQNNINYTNQTKSCMNTLATDGLASDNVEQLQKQSGGGGVVQGTNSDSNSWRFMSWNEDTNLSGLREGGDSSLVGASIPESYVQKVVGHLDGTKPMMAPSDSDITIPNNSNMFCEKGSCLSSGLLPDKIPNQTNKMPDIEMSTVGRDGSDFAMEEVNPELGAEMEMSGGSKKHRNKKQRQNKGKKKV